MPVREPDLTADDVEWLRTGGPFPESVIIERQDGSKFTFELEDQNVDGHIYGGYERRGKKGFVLFGRDIDSDESVALKFCVETDYLGTRTPQEETRLAALLRPLSTTVAVPRQTGKVAPFPSQPDPSCGWVCFVSERIYGSTLKEWAKKNPNSITPDKICEIAVTLVKVVLFLEAKQLKHDDLHWGNLMLRDVDPAVRIGRPYLPENELCVIDTGSLKHIEQPTSKPHDDWSQAANVLANLHAVVFKNRQLAARSAGMLRQLEVFCAEILEGDRSRSFPTQESFYTAIERMRTELRTGEASKVHDFDPFGVISAEHLADDTLLLDLFVKTLPWMSEVSRPSPMVIQGPRGCGKSMLFRYLSARTHIGTGDAASQLKNLPFFGIYLSCSSDLQSELFWLSSRNDLVAQRRESIVTLFNLLLVREFFRTIDKLLYRKEIATNADVSEADVATLITYCREQLGASSSMPRLRVASIAGDFADELDVLRRTASNAVATGTSLETPLPYYFLRDFAAIATQTIGFLKGRQIVFLLDDYTSHRVPAAVQRLLNPIVFARQPTYVFKVSCEYFGIDTTTEAGLRIDQNREYESIDTGAWVVERLNSRRKREFIEALIDRRLERAGYAGRSSNLIGRSPFKKDSELAQRIKTLKTGKHGYYSGLDVLGNLWSGDIATIIHFIRTMFQRGAVKRDQVKQIEATAQHEAVREVSRGLVLTVQGYDPHGKAMHQILEQFGGLASDLLRSSKEDLKNTVNDDAVEEDTLVHPSIPQRKYRIEMTKLESYDVFAELSARSDGTPDLGSLAQEMIRRSVFLELRPSTGKEGRDKETVRWQLRAALLPAFGLSLVHRSYLNVVSINDLVTLLAEPKAFRDSYFARYSTDKSTRKALHPSKPKTTRDLFESKEPQ